MGQLDGKVALVTGGAAGIGRACAERLAREGAAVLVTDVEETGGHEVVQAIVQAGGQAEFRRLDVASEGSWIAVIDEARDRHGRLDVLVNNAGIAIRVPVVEMELADFRRELAINVEGVFLGCKHAIPLMAASGGGSIINMSSTAGLRGSPNMAGYSASKGAVRLFTKAVAMECATARNGVRVNSVHPGVIETAIWASMDAGRTGVSAMPDLDALSDRLVPLGFKGLPADIASGVLWLATDESRYVTGAELVIDGGLSGR
jgi:NAD(P)-dependent dehydrogenase (short-subunit alcohol dehydrogenase family)